jgi:hypothetical protein
VRFVIFAPDSRREPSPPSGRKSTQPTVQILEASSAKRMRSSKKSPEPSSAARELVKALH